jgi:hypothetical protein
MSYESYKQTILEHKGYTAQIMEAPRLIGEADYGLPPGSPLPAYPIDIFVKIPENWMRGPGVFIVPVRSDTGLWFNFRQNSEINTAVIMTVRGCNPITGLQTSGFHLEKYEKKCPKHGCDFLVERFCPECNYKWPDRNFLSGSPLWWDIWKTADGIGRQFYFTEDELKDIATHKIGAENTVPAFGFAFYGTRERRPEISGPIRGLGYPTPVLDYGTEEYATGGFLHPGFFDNSGIKINYQDEQTLTNTTATSASQSVYSINSGVLSTYTAHNVSSNITKNQETEVISCKNFMPENNIAEDISEDCKEPKQNKEVSIGAGAKILQDLPFDPYPLDTWRDTPDAVMTIYFVFQEKLEELKAGGIRDLEGVKEGMLQGLPVG